MKQWVLILLICLLKKFELSLNFSQTGLTCLIIEIYIYTFFRLCGVPVSEFDPKLNEDQLSVCLEQILVLYNKVKTDKYSDSRQEMEALYQIIQLGNTNALLRGLILSEQQM